MLGSIESTGYKNRLTRLTKYIIDLSHYFNNENYSYATFL